MMPSANSTPALFETDHGFAVFWSDFKKNVSFSIAG
jgi:hypothetical protein